MFFRHKFISQVVDVQLYEIRLASTTMLIDWFPVCQRSIGLRSVSLSGEIGADWQLNLALFVDIVLFMNS